MPFFLAKARTARCSSAVICQPVGLPGELTKIARVRSSTASNSRCRSSFQPPSGLRSSATYFVSPIWPNITSAAQRVRGEPKYVGLGRKPDGGWKLDLQQLHRRGDVRPDRRDDHDIVARIEQ